jgi:hypothetical protein
VTRMDVGSAGRFESWIISEMSASMISLFEPSWTREKVIVVCRVGPDAGGMPGPVGWGLMVEIKEEDSDTRVLKARIKELEDELVGSVATPRRSHLGGQRPFHVLGVASLVGWPHCAVEGSHGEVRRGRCRRCSWGLSFSLCAMPLM